MGFYQFPVRHGNLHAVYLLDPKYRFTYYMFDKDPTEIYIHWTGDHVRSLEEVYREGVQRFGQPMYHFIINRKGRIYQTLPINVKGVHTKYHDDHSFGIALHNVVSPSSFTPAMKYSLDALVSYLSIRYPIREVRTHFESHVRSIEEALETVGLDRRVLIDPDEVDQLLNMLTKERVERFKTELKGRLDEIDPGNLFVRDLLEQRINEIDNCPGAYVIRRVDLSELLEEVMSELDER
ncbi:N-acetylmuramoyl-L-alanine amidase [Candidatus Micrarchaeota archaeon]|nr:N-acetylmuramoyl-L-alanine amidase [Candidatus Micrarchaeota archaeon]